MNKNHGPDGRFTSGSNVRKVSNGGEMRSIVMIVSCLLAGSVPAIANEIFIEDAPLPLPRAFRSSGFDSGWRYARDDAFLFQLADNGDPQARAVAWWHTTLPERRKQWREDITRTNDPAVAALEGLAILDKFAAGEATAKDVSDLFAKTPRGSLGGSGATAIETLALGATIPGWHGDPFQGYWLDDWAIEGVPGAAAALCRVSVTSVNVIPETLHYCRHLAKRGDGDAAYRLGLLYHRRADDFAAGLVPMLNREVGFRLASGEHRR